MTKNPFKLKIIDYLPFFGNITSFLNFKESSFTRRGWAIFEKALSISLTFLCAVEIELLYWQFRFFKPRKESVFVSNYRIRTRTLITTNFQKLNNIQFVIAFFPFFFTFSFLIKSRYNEQLFSYLVKNTLPGISVSHQNLSWETFREMYFKKVVSFSYPFDDNSNISPQKYKDFGSKVALHGEGKYQENHACIPLLTKTTLKKKYGKERMIMGEALHDCHPLDLDEKLQNQGFIERLDVSSNLILLEMKPAWEQKQKQFYIGFLPKKNQIYLNKLPLFFDRKQKVGNKEIVHISNSPLQIKNAKNNNKEKFSEYKFYARKLSFLRSYKDKINLKTKLINKKPNLINIFSKQQFQQKFFDLDELPLKLDQNCSEILSSKTPENQCCESNMLPVSFPRECPMLPSRGKSPILISQAEHTSLFPSEACVPSSIFPSEKKRAAQDTTTLAAQRKDQSASLNSSILITQGSLIPNLFETLQTFPNPIVTSDLLDFSSNKERNIHNIENGLADQTKLLNTSFEENESTDESEENVSTDESEENESTDESEENVSTDESEENVSTDESEENVSTDESERLPLPNEPTQEKRYDQEDQKPIFIKELLEKSHKDGEEETFYKKLFLENELKKVFYNSDFSPSTLPEQKRPRGLISSRLMSGYKYPDMKITTLRSSRIQNLYKNIIFQKQNKELLSMIIELPSSLLTTSFESQPNQIACIPSHEGNPILTDAKQKHEYSLLCESEDPKGASSNEEEKDQEVEGLNFTRTNLPYSYHESEDESGDDAFPPYSYHESEDESGDDAFNIATSSLNEGLLKSEILKGREKSSMLRYSAHNVFSSEGDKLFIKRGNKIEDFFKVPQLKFHYFPTSQTLLNKSLIEKLNISGIYQKVPTIYKQEINLSSKPFALLPLSLWGDISSFPLGENVRPIIKNSVFESSIRRILVLLEPFLYFQKPFQEFWEPVTIQSWLVITKLSFAFIALKIYQNLLINYGKELVFLGFLSENLKEEIGLTDKKKNKGYRLIKKVEKRFKDVAGIDNILPELGEMVWVLRNSGRSFKVGRVLPKGFLFVGPPGTGKTLLAQAIAGEAEVPVLVQSGSSFTDAQSEISSTDAGENERGTQRLTKLFEQARKVAPCIVFIDEIDTLGESRQNVMSNNVGADDLIQSLHKSNQGLTEKNLNDYVNTDKAGNITEKKSRGGFTLSENLQHNSFLSIEKKNKAKQQANPEQLDLLMQFLVELDGLKSRAGIIVIGATNRPKVLDPALTRPGRLDRVLNLELPGKTKRIEILKLYSQNIGLVYGETKKQPLSTTYREGILSGPSFDPMGRKGAFEQTEPKESLFMVGEKTNKARDTQPSIPSFGNHSFSDISNTNHALYPFGDQDFAWEYLANRTFGFSAADLAAAMNLSSIQAILRNTGHTIETIEQGIEFITTYSVEKPKIESTKGAQEVFGLIKIGDKGHLLGKETGSIEKDPFFITRFAYYQAGKAVLHTLLPQHPDAIILKLWPQPKNSRHKNVNLELTSWSLNHRANLETRLIGLYAGKAAELVALSLNSQTKKQTTYPFTRKRTSTIKETKAPNRKIVSLLRTKDVSDVSFLSEAPAAYRKGKDQHVRNFSQYNKRNLSHSSLGIEDLSAASNLAHSLVEKWHFYSNKIAIRRENQIFTNQNQFEISEIGVFNLFQQLTEDVQNRISASNISESTDAKQRIQGEGRDKHSRFNFQEWSIRPWWQNQITEQTGNLNMFYDDWYRIYLPDPEESERNEEWVTPDEYYHNTQNLKNLLPKSSFRKNSYLLPTFKNLTNLKMVGSYFKIVPKGEVKQKNNRSKNKNKAFEPRKEFIFKNRQTRVVKIEDTKNKLNFDVTWNDLYKLDRDYIYHALILTCFNKAFCLLDENRELLDYLADHLMRFEILRQHKIKQIFYDFGCSSLPNQSLTKTAKKDKQKIKFIFDKNWGKNSRRSSSRLLSFDQ